MRSVICVTILFLVLVLGAQAQVPSFNAASVVNAASRVAGPIAPGELVSITGSNLGGAVATSNCVPTGPAGKLPSVCNGASVLVNGQPAPVAMAFTSASASGLTFQVPASVTGGANATIQVSNTSNGQTYQSGIVNVPVAAVTPGLYSFDGSGAGKAFYFDQASSGIVASYSTAVAPGDTVELYGTGFGVDNPAVPDGAASPYPPPASVANVTVSIGGQNAVVQFAGREPYNARPAQPAGADEIIFTVPSGLASGSLPITVTVGGKQANSVNIIVAPTVTSISPNPVPISTSTQTVLVNGTGFQSGPSMVVRVQPELKTQGGPTGPVDLTGSQVTFVSATQLSIQFPPTGTTPGLWTIVVSNPTASGGNGLVTNTLEFSVAAVSNAPTITSVVVTSSQAATIAQNTWIEIHGANLSTATQTWSNEDFSNGLPTSMKGVSAKVNGKSTAVYYISPVQINVLAPLDSALGIVTVQVTTSNGTSNSFSVNEVGTSPAFLVFDVAGHVAAQHSNYALLGPAALSQPGYVFTPAAPGESIILYTTGFGQTNPPITDQAKGAGPLPTPWPQVSIGGIPATVSYAGLISPGLYQLNVVVPQSVTDGELTISATYNGTASQNAKVAVQH